MKQVKEQSSDGSGHKRYAAIYARVSTEDQGRGYSIPTQIEGCQKLADHEGYSVPESHVLIDEGLSGTTMERLALRRLWELVQTHAIRAVIVYDPDRLSRNLIITNGTISGNTADTRGGGVVNSRNDLTLSNLTLIRTLVSGNTAPVGPEIFNDGAVVADSHNLFGVNGNAGVEGFSPGPTDVVPPAGFRLPDILDPILADNGGPTQTHALVPGSPAIDAGGRVCLDADGDPLTTDQRGQPRPVDGNGDGIAACDIGAFELQPRARTVALDIKPGTVPNPINPKSHGVIPVAILTTSTFDATTVDPMSVRFGPRGAKEAHNKGHIEDVNRDGEPDLVLHFKIQATGITCGDTSASLTGETRDGDPIQGSDAITTVGCKH
jgi:hypothetical protein